MPKFINKQTWEFEVQWVAEGADENEAREVELTPSNITSISSLNTDWPWDTEEIDEMPTITTEAMGKLIELLNEVIRITDTAEAVSSNSEDEIFPQEVK